MGAFSGSITYKLFYVQGDLPSGWKTSFIENIKRRSFEPLHPDDEDEEKIGWVPIERPLQQEFVPAEVYYNDFLNLSLRQDRYVLPTDLMKAHLAEAERDYMRQNDKKKLSKFEREDIKNLVRQRLKEQTMPRMRLIDMSWELSSMRVRFWSQSSKMGELFQGYFEDTFDLKILPANPYINALQLDLTSEEIEALGDVEPSNFVEATTGIDY